MTLSIYSASVPVFLHALGVLRDLLDKGEAFATETGRGPDTLVSARLAPDMYTLAGQVQRACDTAKLSVCRLAAATPPQHPDNETSIADLRQRVDVTRELLRSFGPESFADSDTRAITLGSGDNQRRFQGGADYLLGFALPNFFFHVTTAYDILRHEGVPLGKRDFLGAAGRPGA